ncbi:unnamed protein product [Symbiodinium necroappetens]|uniref:Uncharacterized protein n=1 Tax=Symbiodinium necroappetens TaxID=1628268 RepID=A0A813A8Z0_9DINO|nr:unnamed protein product [Symbiodinium necroappetens]
MAVPLFFEFAVREWIAASFQSQDSDSLIQGFRQMLKGISDGELLLDGSFQICGSAPCLQRLLSSREDFAGRSFRELIVDDEAKELFDHFLAPAASDGEDPETTVQLESTAAPRCLRVPLRDCAGRAISVDVFHVSLQPCLYGESTTCHLLALKEDVRSVEPPEVDPAQNALPSSLLASRRAPTAHSAASSESCVECHDELAEMTLLVNASTELLDIEEVHLRYVRRTDDSKVQMGMPTLKRFARPLDWAGIDAVLRRYARKVRKARARGEEEVEPAKQVLPSMTLRIPGESRKHLCSRCVEISPLPRQHAGEDVFLYINLFGFEGPTPPPRRLPSLSSLDEDASLCTPAPVTLGQELHADEQKRHKRRLRTERCKASS